VRGTVCFDTGQPDAVIARHQQRLTLLTFHETTAPWCF
jgi:hypothetical protein